MGMIGNQLAAGQALTVANDSFNGDGSTTSFTLSQTVGSVHDIEVLVDNVQQSPYDGSYSVSGTTLTFSGTPSTGTNNIYVIYNASKHITTQQVIPDDGSVTHSKFHTNALDPITLDPTNNRVGIGTTTPSQQFHVNSSGNTRALIETTNPGSVAELQIKNTAQTVKLGIETSSDAGGGAYGNAGASEFVIQYGANAGLVVDTSGRTKQPNQPAFRVGKTSAQQGSGGSYLDPITFDVATYNIGNHFSTSTNKFTAPVAGRYLFGWLLGCYRYSATWMGVYSYKNNAYLDYTQSFNYSAPSWVNFDGSILVDLATNDTFHIVLRHDSNAGVDNSGCFWGYLVG